MWYTNGTRLHTGVAKIGFKHPHILHSTFALTALHLARCRPDRKEEYVKIANHHYERALALVTPEIAKIHPDNCDAVLGTVHAMCFISWARGPQPGEYLAFAREGQSDWLLMFRGVRATLESIGKQHYSHARTAAAQKKAPAPKKERTLPVLEVPGEYDEQLDRLHEYVEFISKDTPAFEGDMMAVQGLRAVFENRYQGKDSEFHVAFGWLYCVPDDFLDRLQQRTSTALIVYAHFIVLLHDMERFWYMKGWTHHVMSGIFEALDDEHMLWITWPMAQVGWIAP